VYTDKTLTCRDCGASFIFTTGEQEFYASRGLLNEPGRCPECRGARNRSRDSGYGGQGGGGYERRERQMYPATCAQCGKATQVPFEPRNDRPVYCSDCYETRRPGGGSSDRRGGSRW